MCYDALALAGGLHVDWREDRIGAAERGENPMVLARLRSGYAVLGDTQFLPGYCVLLAAPRVPSLEALSPLRRQDFLLDMSLIGDALLMACQPLRINYSIYGNTDHYLHAHVFPRYAWEPAPQVALPVWRYAAEMWHDPAHTYDPVAHAALRRMIGEALRRVLHTAYS